MFWCLPHRSALLLATQQRETEQSIPTTRDATLRNFCHVWGPCWLFVPRSCCTIPLRASTYGTPASHSFVICTSSECPRPAKVFVLRKLKAVRRMLQAFRQKGHAQHKILLDTESCKRVQTPQTRCEKCSQKRKDSPGAKGVFTEPKRSTKSQDVRHTTKSINESVGGNMNARGSPGTLRDELKSSSSSSRFQFRATRSK